VEERVAQVQDAPAAGLHEPRHLRVARAVGGGDGRDRERARLDRRPGIDRTAGESGGGQLLVGLRDRRLLEERAAPRPWFEHRRVRGQVAGERGGVGVVAVQVGDEARDGVAPAAHHVGCGDRRGALAEGREHGACVLERVDHQARPLGLDLDSGPAQPADLHATCSPR